MVVGHQPIGDAPLVLSTRGRDPVAAAGDVEGEVEGEMIVVCGDTSYARDVKWGLSEDDIIRLEPYRYWTTTIHTAHTLSTTTYCIYLQCTLYNSTN